jgi:hypothetical protein
VRGLTVKWTLWSIVIGCLAAQDSIHPGVRVISGGSGWSLDTRRIARNDTLPVIASVTGRAYADGLILDCGKKGWLAYQCGKVPCRLPVCRSGGSDAVQRVDPAAQDRHISRSLPSIVISLIRREPREVVPAGVRDGTMAEGVILKDAQGVYWAPVLKPVVDGPHCFHLTALPRPKDKPIDTFRVDWRHSDTGSGTAKSLDVVPGLYTVQEGILDSAGACKANPEASSRWILVAGPADWKRIAPEWERTSRYLGRLGRRKIAPAAISTIRHAHLAYWADLLAAP